MHHRAKIKLRVSPMASVFALACASLVAAGKLEQQDVFVSRQGGYHTYRIPSLLVTQRGTLLAFCEGRKQSAADSGDIDVIFKRSTDYGQTWSAPKIIWDDGSNTCGNPCAVLDRDTGKIWLLLTHNIGTDNEVTIKSKKSAGTRTVWISMSDDDGSTWSSPREITSTTKNPAWGWYATGPGVGIQIQHGPRQGRLIVPCDHSYASEQDPSQIESGSHVIYSDDHGKTWAIGGSVGPKLNECQVVEVNDGAGTLLLSLRNYPRGTRRAQALSRDGGASWSAPEQHPDLIDPTCQASILRFAWPEAGQRDRILFSNPASDRRRNLTVRVSYDGGRTWPVGRSLFEKNAAYSCLGALANGEVGCCYECGETNAYEKIVFAHFPMSWLESGP